jgi:hypothetical protein
MSQFPFFSFLRISSVLFILILKIILPHQAYESLFYAVLFGHYVMAVFYSKIRNLDSVRTPDVILPFIFLGLLGFTFSFIQAPDIALFFGIHHSLTETYAIHNDLSLDNKKVAKPLSLSRFCLNLALYLCLIRHESGVIIFPVEFLIAWALFSFGFFLLSIREVCRSFLLTKVVDLVAFEGVGILITLCLFKAEVKLIDAIFYHLIFWILYPLKGKVKLSNFATKKYCLTILALTGGFFIFTPRAGFISGITLNDWFQQAMFWGYLHITFSFGFSKLNPAWIRRLFVNFL